MGDKSIISRVAFQATRVCGWLASDTKIRAKVVILTPHNDPIKDELSHKYTIIEGDEDNVISRFKTARDLFDADYMVRLTGDCAWIPARVISKHIRDAVKTNSDYTSNVLVRTFQEGYDCEVMSIRLFDWLEKQELSDFEKEHVTIKICEDIKTGLLPGAFKVHTVLNDYDLSNIKTSIDTQEEYNQAVMDWSSFQKKRYEAINFGGVSQ
jgi:spore coat polysaccharide biosynthesis protein SpsF (cytidylyltransferase family)